VTSEPEVPIALAVSFRAVPGRVEVLRDVLLRLSSASLAEEGCQRYDVHEDLDDDSRLWLYELWDDQRALDEHDTTEHVRSFLRDVPPLLRESFQRWRLRPLGPLR
jgi:quinol monooxygenase YgiN